MTQRVKETQSGRGADRPLVLLATLNYDLTALAIEHTRDWHWDLRALWISDYEWPTDKPVAGALLQDLPTDPGAKRILGEGIPAVRLGGQPHPDDARLPAVLPDQAAQGRLAVDHFHERGFKHVGFVGFHPKCNDANNYRLFAAFRERADELGMACHLLAFDEVAGPESPVRYRARRKALGKWLSELPKPVGVFSFADFMMVKVSLACSHAGLFVPEEVALLGCGNSITGQLTQVSLSSLDTATEQQVVTALELLRDLMDGKPAPQEPILVPPEGVVVRTSTDVLAVPDLAVARALRFIWEHFRENLSIQDIADAVGMPRRSLERGFHTHLNRSVHAELKRKRVAELRHLLLTTHEPIADLAPRAGFCTLTHANRCFRATYGVSPGKYRAKHGGPGRVTR